MHHQPLENEMSFLLCCHPMASQEQQVSRVKNSVQTLS